jgi:CBS domain-containing protein/sporulation protein YlmC with PRC-barrel domain
MLYFSELKNKKVITQNYNYIGKLKDIIFLASETPLITKIVIKNSEKKNIIIPIEFVQKIDKVINISSEYKILDNGQENELYIVNNLLDKQIIDVKGGKVVRVNDVAIQYKVDKNKYYISGVDIGLRGILRWLRLEKFALPLYRLFGIYSHPHFLSWGDIEPLELASGKVKLKKSIEELERMRPEDLANYLEKTNIRNVDKILAHFEDQFAADVIADLNVNYQTSLFKRFSSEKNAKIIEKLDPDEAVDILLALKKEKRDEILNLVSEKTRKELNKLIKYSKTPIGELINPKFITISADETAGSALVKFKNKITNLHFSAYLYVVNKKEELVGVLNLSVLITKPHNTPIYTLMEQNVVVIHLTTPKEIAIKKLFRYKLYALPVIDDNKKMIGIVTYDDLVEDLIEKL